MVELKGTPGFEEFDYYSDPKRHQMVFFFPLTHMSYCITFPEDEFYFDDLISMSKGLNVTRSNLSGIYLYKVEGKGYRKYILSDLIPQKMDKEYIESKEDIESSLINIYYLIMEYSPLLVVLTLIKNTRSGLKKIKKSKLRISVKLVLKDSSKINLSIVNINLISAHYSQARQLNQPICVCKLNLNNLKKN